VENNLKVYPLKLSSEFSKISRYGHRVRASGYLTLLILSSEDKKTYFGITASKKVGNAVIRNKLKRWVRNCVQSEKWKFKYRGKKVVFMFRTQKDDFYYTLKYKEFFEIFDNE